MLNIHRKRWFCIYSTWLSMWKSRKSLILLGYRVWGACCPIWIDIAMMGRFEKPNEIKHLELLAALYPSLSGLSKRNGTGQLAKTTFSVHCSQTHFGGSCRQPGAWKIQTCQPAQNTLINQSLILYIHELL